jgi:hypothetical protein
MKRWIAIFVMVLVVGPVGARADEASKQAKVKELFATMHMEHNLDRMRSAMEQQVEATAKNAPGTEAMTPEKKKAQQDFIDGSMKVVDENFGWSVLEAAYVKLYADTYTETELDGILAFYKSPAGQAMLVKTPELSAGVMQIVHGRMDDFQPKMQALQAQYVKAMAPAGQ